MDLRRFEEAILTHLFGVSLVVAGDVLIGVVHTGAVHSEPVYHACHQTGQTPQEKKICHV